MYRGILTGAPDGVRTDSEDCKADDALRDFEVSLDAALQRQSKATADIAPTSRFKLHHISSEAVRLTSGKVAVYVSTTTEIVLDGEDVANVDAGIEAMAIVHGHFWTGIR